MIGVYDFTISSKAPAGLSLRPLAFDSNEQTSASVVCSKLL
jgi:hypothetical protein